IETAPRAFQMTDNAQRVGKCIGILAQKTGIYGMIGGQTVDVELTDKLIPKDKLDFIYRLKTGALLEAAMVRSLFSTKTKDFITAVDEKDIILVKEVKP
ncbi:polyprenyl synthetase family protein, partial [[Clostridium] symbiosum]|nr:polyprenyl synthetase family protein [[Clostridium] symbiosum]